MPTYEYECVECGIRYEVIQPMADAVAPLCCSHSMKQIYTPFGIVLKGKGWGHQ